MGLFELSDERMTTAHFNMIVPKLGLLDESALRVLESFDLQNPDLSDDDILEYRSWRLAILNNIGRHAEVVTEFEDFRKILRVSDVQYFNSLFSYLSSLSEVPTTSRLFFKEEVKNALLEQSFNEYQRFALLRFLVQKNLILNEPDLALLEFIDAFKERVGFLVPLPYGATEQAIQMCEMFGKSARSFSSLCLRLQDVVGIEEKRKFVSEFVATEKLKMFVTMAEELVRK
jgi:hypothetical protein